MIHFKDAENKLHALDSLEWVHLLPQDCVQITDEEAQAIANPPKTLDELKLQKQSEIRAQYEIKANATVIVGTGLNAVTYQGGFDSAIKLDAAKRLSEAAGLTGVTFYDVDNIAHTLLLADAMLVVIQVSAAFQTALGKKQAAMVACTQALDEAELALVQY